MANEFRLDYTGAEINQKLASLDSKADLDENGKIPVEQIPDDVGRTQLQADFNQTDENALDYIKNKPFYTLPPEQDFKSSLTYQDPIIEWDGNIENRPGIYCQDIYYYKVSDEFLNSDMVTNGYLTIGMPLESLGDGSMKEIFSEYNMIQPLIPALIEMSTVYSDDDYYISMCICSTKRSGPFSTMVEDMVYEFDFPEPGTYFLYDKSGNVFGEEGFYVRKISGPMLAPDETNENISIVEDMFGPGSKMVTEKVLDSYLEKDKIINANLDMYIASWDPESIFEGGMHINAKYNSQFEEYTDGFLELMDFEDGSYVIAAQGMPLFASIKESIAESGINFPGPATYLVYCDLKDSAMMELKLNNIRSAETVFQIDSKYIPKQEIIHPNYEEMNPESDAYILNKPYYNQSYYNSFYGSLDESLQVLHSNDKTKFYQWGCELPDDLKTNDIYNDGKERSDLKVTEIFKSTENGSMQIKNNIQISDASSSKKVKYIYTYNSSGNEVYAYISFEDAITAKVLNPWKNTYEDIYFPKAGIYYLCDMSSGSLYYVNQLGLYRKRNNLPTPDWNVTSSNQDGYIQNKPFSITDWTYFNDIHFDPETNLETIVTIPGAGDSYFSLASEDVLFNNVDLSNILLSSFNVSIQENTFSGDDLSGYKNSNGSIIFKAKNKQIKYNNFTVADDIPLAIYVPEGKTYSVYFPYKNNFGGSKDLYFPTKGLYFLYSKEFYNIKLTYVSGSFCSYESNSKYFSDWEQLNETHPGYIKNKPSITDEVSSYSSSLITSRGVYNALANMTSLATMAIDDETGEPTALNNYYTKAEVDALLDEIRLLIQEKTLK